MMDEALFENKYRIGELLGEGGMGVVHAAINIFSDADVAIKRIPKAIAERHALGQRLRRESKVLALVIHPNIVRLLDCGVTQDGDLYIVMERVDGDPLRALMRRAAKCNETLDMALVLHAMVQIADAMDLAHRKGIYHRDLKPENIMVCEGGHAKVLDFGLAKTPSTGPLTAPNPTNPANVVGTPKYMAPEQVRGLAVDGRTDIYALGVVVYEAICGHTPFASEEDEGSTLTEIMGHHVFAEPRPLRELVPGCPTEVWNVVLCCLAKKPEDRFSSMSELARALRRCEENEATRKAASVERRQRRAAPREARVTEPMPESFHPVNVLPFAAPSFARSPEALRELRVTEPMPAPVLRPLPAREPPASEGRGKGYTVRLRPLSANATQEIPRDGGDIATRSGAGFVYESTWPEARRRRAAPPAAVAAPRHTRIPGAAAPSRKIVRRGAPPFWLALPGGFALATFGLVATMIARSPRYTVEPPAGPVPAVEVQPGSSPPAPEPVAWPSGPLPVAIAAGAAPLAPRPAPAARAVQRATPPAAPIGRHPELVPLFSTPLEKAPAPRRRTSGVMK